MKKTSYLLIVSLLVLNTTGVSCATESDDWKNNTGTVNLDQLSVTGDGISVNGNTVSITKGGDFTISGTLADGMIYVNSEEKVKLRLKNASITNSTGPAIYFENTEKSFITISKDTENYLSDGNTYTDKNAKAVLFSNDDLEIKGSGMLTIQANYKHGIAGDDDVKIEEGTINITSLEHSIKANDTLEILGGTISAVSETGKGLKADLEIIIEDGDINIEAKADEGIESEGILTINGGNINIVAADDGINTGNSSTVADTQKNTSPEMPEGQMPRGDRGMRGHPPRDINSEIHQIPEGKTPPELPDRQTPPEMPEGVQPPEIPEGQMPPGMPNREKPQRGGGMGGFDMVDEETAAAHAVTINGGTLSIETLCDGIDSNGNLIINGGTVIIDGPADNGNGPLDSQGEFEINGGTVICASSLGMVQLPRNQDGQNIVRINFNEKQLAGTVVSITQNGEEIVSHTGKMEFSSFIFSSDTLKSDNEYKILLNGTEYESFTVTAGITSVGNNMGGFGSVNRGMNKEQRKPDQQKDIRVSVNGNPINFNSKPTIKNNTTLVGYRAIMEALGVEVTWDAETKTVTAIKDNITIIMTIGSDTAYVNGDENKLLTPPEIINNSTMIPIRFLSEQLGMTVNWDENERSVSINEKL